MLALAGRTLGANEKRLLDVMEDMTRAEAHRQKAYDVVTKLVERTGSAPVWLLQTYNESALDLLQDQQKVIDLLASLAVPGLSFQAPWPPLFVDRSRSDLSSLKLPPLSEGVLPAENFSVFFQAPKALPSGSAGGAVAAAPLLLWWGVVAIGAVAAYFISDNYQQHKTIQLENALAAEVERMRLKAYELQLAQVRWKALFTTVQTAKCDSVTVLEKVQCYQRAMIAAENTPPPPDLGKVLLDMKKLQLQSALGGHSVLFWLGVSVATGAVAFGGYKIWKHRDEIRRKLT